MLGNRKLSKAISDASWSEFIRQLEYKAKWYGRTIAKISPLVSKQSDLL
jgi:putative transposase